MAKPKSRNIWGRFLLIWALVLLVVGAIACILLYKYLGVYENTRPELAMDELLASRDAESLIQEAKQNINLGLTEFEDELQLYADYLETVDWKSLSPTVQTRKTVKTTSSSTLCAPAPAAFAPSP